MTVKLWKSKPCNFLLYIKVINLNQQLLLNIGFVALCPLNQMRRHVLLITFPSGGKMFIFGKIFMNSFSLVLCCRPLLTLYRYIILSDNCHWSLPVSLFALENPQELQHPMNNTSVTGGMRLHAKGKNSYHILYTR